MLPLQLDLFGAPVLLPAHVRAAADAVPVEHPGSWGSRKVFVRAVAEQLAVMHGGDWREYLRVLRAKLADWNAKDEIEATRADLVPMMPLEYVKDSHVEYGNADFHLITRPHPVNADAWEEAHGVRVRAREAGDRW